MEEQTHNHKETCLIEALGLTHEWLEKAHTKMESLFIEEKISDKKELIQKMIEWVKDDDYNHLGEKMFIISEMHSEIISNLTKKMLVEKLFGGRVAGLGLEFDNETEQTQFHQVLKSHLKNKFPNEEELLVEEGGIVIKTKDKERGKEIATYVNQCIQSLAPQFNGKIHGEFPTP